MLRGIEENTIIVGAYADSKSGGICPMLAAHRNGGRTDLASFARSWDRYTGARRPRLATRREIRTLVALLESSLLAEEGAPGSVASLARQLRSERAAAAERIAAAADASETPQAPPPLAPPERPGMRISIRRLRRQGRRRRQAAGVG